MIGNIRNRKITKALSVAVALVFIVSNLNLDALAAVDTGVAPYAPALAVGPSAVSTLDVETFSIPVHLGDVKHSYKGSGEKIVLHVQDAHCNEFAQRKVSEIIQYLHREYGLTTLNLEGGVGPYDLNAFTSISGGEIRREVAAYFVKKGELNGAEYFAINNTGAVDLWGVEDRDLYLANLAVYRESLEYRPEVDKYLGQLTYILDNFKRRIYPRDLLVIDRAYNAYKEGTSDFRSYLEFIIGQARDRMISVKKYPNLYLLAQAMEQEGGIDFQKANIERGVLVDELKEKLSRDEIREMVSLTVQFKTKKISQKVFYGYLLEKARAVDLDLKRFPALQNYIVYVSVYEAVDRTEVMGELDSIENEIKETLFRNATQRELDLLSKNLAILKNVFGIRLNREDYEYYLGNINFFEAGEYLRFIQKEGPRYKIEARPDPGIVRLDGYRDRIEKFYEYSFKRDDVFLRNMRFTEMPGGVKGAFLMTGGFHTDNLCQLFRKNDISFVSILPRFTTAKDYNNPYFDLLAGQVTDVQRMLRSALARSSNMQIASFYSSLGLDVWGRDGLLMNLAEIYLVRMDKEGRCLAIKRNATDTSPVIVGNPEGQLLELTAVQFLGEIGLSAEEAERMTARIASDAGDGETEAGAEAPEAYGAAAIRAGQSFLATALQATLPAGLIVATAVMGWGAYGVLAGIYFMFMPVLQFAVSYRAADLAGWKGKAATQTSLYERITEDFGIWRAPFVFSHEAWHRRGLGEFGAYFLTAGSPFLAPLWGAYTFARTALLRSRGGTRWADMVLRQDASVLQFLSRQLIRKDLDRMSPESREAELYDNAWDPFFRKFSYISDNSGGGTITRVREDKDGNENAAGVSAGAGYSIKGQLGEGGMGEVFLADRRGVSGGDQEVAVKMPRGDIEGELKAYFLKEAAMLYYLRGTEGVVNIRDSGYYLTGFNKKRYFIVMDKVEGENLEELIKSGELGTEDKARITRQMLEIVQRLHDKKVLCRDIKPENFIYDRETGKLTLIDMGLAVYAPSGYVEVPPDGFIFGTEEFISPELAYSRDEKDFRYTEENDMFAVAMTLYMMFSGTSPYSVGDRALSPWRDAAGNLENLREFFTNREGPLNDEAIRLVREYPEGTFEHILGNLLLRYGYGASARSASRELRRASRRSRSFYEDIRIAPTPATRRDIRVTQAEQTTGLAPARVLPRGSSSTRATKGQPHAITAIDSFLAAGGVAVVPCLLIPFLSVYGMCYTGVLAAGGYVLLTSIMYAAVGIRAWSVSGIWGAAATPEMTYSQIRAVFGPLLAPFVFSHEARHRAGMGELGAYLTTAGTPIFMPIMGLYLIGESIFLSFFSGTDWAANVVERRDNEVLEYRIRELMKIDLDMIKGDRRIEQALSTESWRTIFSRADWSKDDLELRPRGTSRVYRIMRRHGKGGFGFVHHAISMRRGEPQEEVAIKTIRMATTAGARDARLMFLKEAAILRHLSGVEGIVGFRGAGFYREGGEDHLYIAMDMVEGESLKTLIESGGLTDDDKDRVTEQLLAIVAGMHERGVINRDIKPDNLIYDKKTGKLTLIDLGAAVYSPEGRLKAMSVVGTPQYIAPELVDKTSKDYRVFSKETDMFAVAVTLYLMYMGDFPYTRGPSGLRRSEVFGRDPLRFLRAVRKPLEEESTRLVNTHEEGQIDHFLGKLLRREGYGAAAGSSLRQFLRVREKKERETRLEAERSEIARAVREADGNFSPVLPPDVDMLGAEAASGEVIDPGEGPEEREADPGAAEPEYAVSAGLSLVWSIISAFTAGGLLTLANCGYFGNVVMVLAVLIASGFVAQAGITVKAFVSGEARAATPEMTYSEIRDRFGRVLAPVVFTHEVMHRMGFNELAAYPAGIILAPISLTAAAGLFVTGLISPGTARRFENFLDTAVKAYVAGQQAEAALREIVSIEEELRIRRSELEKIRERQKSIAETREDLAGPVVLITDANEKRLFSRYGKAEALSGERSLADTLNAIRDIAREMGVYVNDIKAITGEDGLEEVFISAKRLLKRLVQPVIGEDADIKYGRRMVLIPIAKRIAEKARTSSKRLEEVTQRAFDAQKDIYDRVASRVRRLVREADSLRLSLGREPRYLDAGEWKRFEELSRELESLRERRRTLADKRERVREAVRAAEAVRADVQSLERTRGEMERDIERQTAGWVALRNGNRVAERIERTLSSMRAAMVAFESLINEASVRGADPESVISAAAGVVNALDRISGAMFNGAIYANLSPSDKERVLETALNAPEYRTIISAVTPEIFGNAVQALVYAAETQRGPGRAVDTGAMARHLSYAVKLFNIMADLAAGRAVDRATIAAQLKVEASPEVLAAAAETIKSILSPGMIEIMSFYGRAFSELNSGNGSEIVSFMNTAAESVPGVLLVDTSDPFGELYAETARQLEEVSTVRAGLYARATSGEADLRRISTRLKNLDSDFAGAVLDVTSVAQELVPLEGSEMEVFEGTDPAGRIGFLVDRLVEADSSYGIDIEAVDEGIEEIENERESLLNKATSQEIPSEEEGYLEVRIDDEQEQEQEPVVFPRAVTGENETLYREVADFRSRAVKLAEEGRLGELEELIGDREAAVLGDLARGRENVVAVSDIHGSLVDLRMILERATERDIDKFVFCGDYMDRGPNGIAVIEELMSIQANMSERGTPEKAKFLMGNHDLFFLQSMYIGDAQSLVQWLLSGGERVLEELGLDRKDTGIANLVRRIKDFASEKDKVRKREKMNAVMMMIVQDPGLALTIQRLDTSGRLMRAAEWMSENLDLYHIDGNNILYLHAGLPLDAEGRQTLSYKGSTGIEALEKMQGDLKRDLSNIRETAQERTGVFQVLDSQTSSPVWVRGWTSVLTAKSRVEALCDSLGVRAIVFGHDARRDVLNVNGMNMVVGIDSNMLGGSGGALFVEGKELSWRTQPRLQRGETVAMGAVKGGRFGLLDEYGDFWRNAIAYAKNLLASAKSAREQAASEAETPAPRADTEEPAASSATKTPVVTAVSLGTFYRRSPLVLAVYEALNSGRDASGEIEALTRGKKSFLEASGAEGETRDGLNSDFNDMIYTLRLLNQLRQSGRGINAGQRTRLRRIRRDGLMDVEASLLLLEDSANDANWKQKPLKTVIDKDTGQQRPAMYEDQPRWVKGRINDVAEYYDSVNRGLADSNLEESVFEAMYSRFLGDTERQEMRELGMDVVEAVESNDAYKARALQDRIVSGEMLLAPRYADNVMVHGYLVVLLRQLRDLLETRLWRKEVLRDENGEEVTVPFKGHVVAVGDIHQEFQGFRVMLEGSGIIVRGKDDSGSQDVWIGGPAKVVQLGDFFDKYGLVSTVETYKYLRGLRSKAREAGGDVVTLLGNHEWEMLIGAHLAGLTDEEFDESVAAMGEESEKRMLEIFREMAKGQKSAPHLYVDKETGKTLTELMREDILEGNLLAVHEEQGELFAHGVVTRDVVDTLLAGKDDRSAGAFADEANRRFKEAFIRSSEGDKNAFTDIIFNSKTNSRGVGLFYGYSSRAKEGVYGPLCGFNMTVAHDHLSEAAPVEIGRMRDADGNPVGGRVLNVAPGNTPGVRKNTVYFRDGQAWHIKGFTPVLENTMIYEVFRQESEIRDLIGALKDISTPQQAREAASRYEDMKESFRGLIAPDESGEALVQGPDEVRFIMDNLARIDSVLRVIKARVPEAGAEIDSALAVGVTAPVAQKLPGTEAAELGTDRLRQIYRENVSGAREVDVDTVRGANELLQKLVSLEAANGSIPADSSIGRVVIVTADIGDTTEAQSYMDDGALVIVLNTRRGIAGDFLRSGSALKHLIRHEFIEASGFMSHRDIKEMEYQENGGNAMHVLNTMALKHMTDEQLEAIHPEHEFDEGGIFHGAVRAELTARSLKGILDKARPGDHPSVVFVPVTSDQILFDGAPLAGLERGVERALRKDFGSNLHVVYYDPGADAQDIEELVGRELSRIRGFEEQDKARVIAFAGDGQGRKVQDALEKIAGKEKTAGVVQGDFEGRTQTERFTVVGLATVGLGLMEWDRAKKAGQDTVGIELALKATISRMVSDPESVTAVEAAELVRQLVSGAFLMKINRINYDEIREYIDAETAVLESL